MPTNRSITSSEPRSESRTPTHGLDAPYSQLEDAPLDAGKSVLQAKKASQLGRVFAQYLGQQPEFIRETAKRYIAYNLAPGRHWKTPVPAEVRARIRTELGNEHILREHGRAPIDDRERGSFMAKATRQQTTAVAGYDLTFAPVKSVSTLWALADRDVAKQIEDAHHAAVEATLAWLEQEVLFTRRGRGGLQQVKATGLIAGMFTHRDARSSDPHLHTHVGKCIMPETAEHRSLLTIHEAAAYLNMPARWIADAVRQRKVRYARIGKHVRFRIEHLDELIAACEQAVITPSQPVTLVQQPRRKGSRSRL